MRPPERHELLLVRSRMERPFLPDGLLQRQAVEKRLTQFLDRRVILISAPAGYGKSTLVAQYLDSDDAPAAAWLSLESVDSDVGHFLRYVIAALRQVVPDCLAQTERLLYLPTLPSAQRLAESAVAELEMLGQNVALVLDDYHLIRARDIHELLEAMVSQLPRGFQLVVISRSDPPLPLSLWRSRRWLGELRQADLRFSLEETAALFSATVASELGDDHIAILHDKTEGWIAGLQLFLLSLAGQANARERVEAFSASDRLVTDYLLEQVLASEPPEILEYLLVTSVLERFRPQLTDELLSLSHPHLAGRSQEIVDRMFKKNLFLVPLGSVTGWYRYHHLFRDLLRNRLDWRTSQVTKEIVLKTAGEWFRREKYIKDALRCCLQVSDLDTSAAIIGEHLHGIMAEDPSRRSLRRLLDMIPAGAEKGRVPLLIGRAYTKTLNSDYESVDSYLKQIEAACTGKEADQQKKWQRNFQQDLDYLQCFASIWMGEFEKAYEHGCRLRERACNPQGITQSLWTLYYGISLALAGHQEEFRQFVAAGTTRLNTTGVNGQWPFLLVDAIVQLFWGDLAQCRASASRLFTDEQYGAKKYCEGIGSMLLGIAAYECNQLDGAEKYFETALSLHLEAPGIVRWSALTSRIWIALARGCIDDAQQFAGMARNPAIESDNPVLLADLTSIERRLAIYNGKSGITVASRPDYFDLASVEIVPPTQNWAWLQIQDRSLTKRNDALEYISAALKYAEEHGVMQRVIQLRTLRSLALDALDRRDEAISELQTAVKQGSELGFVRSFIDAGEGLRPLLKAIVERQDDDGYAAMLLGALDTPGRPTIRQDGGIAEGLASSTAIQPAPATNTTDCGNNISGDQLTNREMDVLELLQRRLANKEIATRLCISTATVKMHTQNIYNKLDAHGRRRAVMAAIDLGILSR